MDGHARRAAPVSARWVLFAFVVGGAAVLPMHPYRDATAAPAERSVEVAPASGELGELVLVTARNWPKGLATFGVCGNRARRGSQDCELRSTYVVNIPASGTLQVRVPLVTPPVPCPCVVRVATTDNGLVQTRPVEIRGAPVSDVPAPQTVSTAADSVVVTSRVSSTKQGWPASWAPWFAGPVHRRLIVSVENRSEAPTPPLKVIAGVGRDVDDGEALPTRSLGVLQPGARRTVSIPVKVERADLGRLRRLRPGLRPRCSSAVRPAPRDGAVGSRAPSAARPAPDRAGGPVQATARTRRSAAPSAPDVAVPLENCSPDVGVRAAERYRTSPYHPSEPERAPLAGAPANGNGQGEGDRMTATGTTR